MSGGPSAAGGARWQLRLLGDVALCEVRSGPTRLPGRAATALLARLALSPDCAQPRELLVELLWPGATPAVGRNRLRQLLSTLKHLLDGPGANDEVLLADRRAVRLQAQALDCDAAAFETAVRRGRLDEARQLYRGELLPGFYDDWIHEERLRLAAVAERLPDTLPRPPTGGGWPAARAPLRGQPAAPLAALALGLPHYLTALHGAAGVVAQLRADVLAWRLVTLRGPGGLGKTRLAVELAQALAAGPPPGVATTEPDADAVPLFDLLAFVPLVSVPADAGAAEAVLTAALLALRQTPDDQPPLSLLQRRLAGRRALLILDNFEHLVDGAGPAVADLLAACPGLHLLVTSRRALGLDGEHEHALAALPLPALAAPAVADLTAADDAPPLARNPAVALFVDRARAVRASFRLSAHNQPAVVALVRLLQGMPLAIELAASRVRSLSPAALLGLLQQAAADGGSALALLARSGPRSGGDPRHASMLTVVSWSWQLLSPEARRLLPRLSVLASSFSLPTAAALCDEPAAQVAQAVDELVAQSMLRVLADAGDDEPRYALFELVREFAAGVLDSADAAALRRRHRRWLTRWFSRLPLGTPLQQVRPELANLANALLAAEEDGAPAEAAALAAAAQMATSALSLPPQVLASLQRCADRLDDRLQRSLLRASLARAMLLTGQAAAAERLAEQALDELPGADAPLPPGEGTAGVAGLARAQVLTRAAHVRWRLRRDPGAAAWLEEALALASAAQAPALQATILTNLGAVRRVADGAAGIPLQRRALALWAAAGDSHGVNIGRCNLALALMARRAGAEEALALATLAAADSRRLGDERQHALACNLRGEALSRLGRWHEAADAYRDCIAAAYAEAEPWPLVYGLWNLPRAWAHMRRPQPATRLMGFIAGHAPGVSGPFGRADLRDLRRLRRLCAGQAGHADIAAWWQDGAAMPLAQAVRLALRNGEVGSPPRIAGP